MTTDSLSNEQKIIIEVDRVIRELRAGLPVLVYDDAPGGGVILRAAEHAVKNSGSHDGNDELYLLITAARAGRLGREAFRALKLKVSPDTPMEQLAEIIMPDIREISGAAKKLLDNAVDADNVELAALKLLKYSSLLPAGIIIRYKAESAEELENLMRAKNYLAVSTGAIAAYQDAQAENLEVTARARVPLEAAEDAQIAVFRPQGGMAEHLAIIIGKPEQENAPLLRVHSSCLTGDLLGSLRCDCGAQLRAALEQIAAAGSGVVLYLNQEGRGIGISNKLRAYMLQDGGLDTLDANEQLGFDGDERHFRVAAEMLKMLGIDNVRMLTNNPDKVQALTHYGIRVKERMPLVIPAGEHNRDYLATKAKRCGHLF